MVLDILAGIAWDPQLRGILATLVGVVVLMGSVHLLLATNLGNRLGFLVSAAGFFGWLFLMGLTWWAYGTIGMLGEAPGWQVQEVLYPTTQDARLDAARQLDTSALPDPDALSEVTGSDLDALRDEVEPTLGGQWRILPEADPSFGEAKATVDEFFQENADARLGLAGPTDYVTVYAFERGGKDGLPDDPSRLDRITTKFKTTFWQVQHPPRHAIVQIQPVRQQATVVGEPPPTPEANEFAPVVTVVMVRDLGDVRFPAAMVTIASGLMFWVLCVALHRRDQRVVEVRGMLPAPAEA